MTSLAIGPTTTAGPGATDPGTALTERAVGWGRAADISARSALVTILGDTVAPLGGTVWLADVIALAQPFGFNERLIRTSMFRLSAEGWVASERVGRQSRYTLTDYGREETRAAEQRIYRHRVRPWDGSWTLVFLPTDGDGSDEVARHLRWRGFARMADGVHAHPNDAVDETRRLLDRLAIDPTPPVAAARFDGDGEAPIAGAGFRTDSGLAEAEAAYRRFVDRYDRPDVIEAIEAGERVEAGDRPAGPPPVEAFALRTMLIHDLRRARLRDPDLPSALLPADWIGHRAIELAARCHRSISDAAWSWVEQVTGLTVAAEDVVADRFAPTESDARPADQGDRP